MSASRLDPHKLLQRMAAGVVATVAAQRRVRDLAHINVTMGIHPEPMWRGETAIRAGIGATPARQHVALDVAHGHAGHASLRPDAPRETWGIALPGHLTDVDDVVPVDEKIAWSGHVCPGI